MKIIWLMTFLSFPAQGPAVLTKSEWKHEDSCRVALEVMRNTFKPSEGKCVKIIQRET